MAITVGGSQAFGVTTGDPEGDPADVRWLLDGKEVGKARRPPTASAARVLGTHTEGGAASNPNVAGGRPCATSGS
ncbi:MAG: hypothetical protein U0232_20805 [Thermomicrobiales bacterium]